MNMSSEAEIHRCVSSSQIVRVHSNGVQASSEMVEIADLVIEFSPVVTETFAPPRTSAPLVRYSKNAEFSHQCFR